MRSRILPLLAAAICIAGSAFAGDAEFERIVKAIESHYGTQPTHIPFMGAANFFLKVAHPEGASGLKLAVFEDLKENNGGGDTVEWQARDRVMNSVAGGSLHSVIRVHSHGNREATYIFMDPEGRSNRSTRVLIATFGRDNATVVEVKANIDTLLKSLNRPDHAGQILGGDSE